MAADKPVFEEQPDGTLQLNPNATAPQSGSGAPPLRPGALVKGRDYDFSATINGLEYHFKESAEAEALIDGYSQRLAAALGCDEATVTDTEAFVEYLAEHPEAAKAQRLCLRAQWNDVLALSCLEWEAVQGASHTLQAELFGRVVANLQSGMDDAAFLAAQSQSSKRKARGSA